MAERHLAHIEDFRQDQHADKLLPINISFAKEGAFRYFKTVQWRQLQERNTTISNTTIWEVEQGGSDAANGGGFNPQNANMATDLAATSATGPSPVVSSASYNFVAGDVGAYLFIKSGTNWTPGWYKIASVAANAATLNAAQGAAILWESNVPSRPSVSAGCATIASPIAGVWSIDYSQQNAAGVAYTDMVIGATTTQYTSALHPVGVNLVGNVLHVTSGAGFITGWFEVVSVSGTTATCDRSLGTASSTGGNGGLGGALSTPGQAITNLSNSGGQGIFVGPGTFSGQMNSGISSWFVGYNTNRFIWNTDARPTINASANSVNILSMSGNNKEQMIRNFIVDGNGHLSVTGISLNSNGAQAVNCAVNNCATAINLTGFSMGGIAINCTFDNASSTGIDFQTSGAFAYGCIGTTLSTGTAYALVGGAVADRCIARAKDSTSQTVGFGGNGMFKTINCVAYGFSATPGAGFILGIDGGGNTGQHINAVAWGCYTNFKTAFANTRNHLLLNCAGGGATSVNVDPNFIPGQIVNFQTLTADPFTSASTGDFSPNSAAGGGALLKRNGSPAAANLDIGAIQTSAAAGGGPIGGGNIRGNFGN